MLGIILAILKIILILIGVILGVVLLILAVLLFNRCRFEVVGNKYEKLKVSAKFKWLFGIIKGYYEIDGDITKYSLYIPFGICNIKYNSEESNINFDLDEKNICNDDEIINKSIANIEKNSKIDNIVKKIKAFFTKIKNFITYLAEKIKLVQRFNCKYCINSLISATWKLLIRLIKNLGLKKLELNGIIGFDNPADTGNALGAISIVKTFLPLNVNIDGNFENKELTGDFNIKGRTNLWLILFPIAKYVFTKPVWPVVKDYWKGELNG